MTNSIGFFITQSGHGRQTKKAVYFVRVTMIYKMSKQITNSIGFLSHNRGIWETKKAVHFVRVTMTYKMSTDVDI